MSDYGIGAPPPGMMEEEGGKIGVPAGYKAPGKKPKWGIPKNVAQYRASQPITPKYNIGDDTKPASWNPERIADLQAQMVDAGILNPREYQRGWWDPKSKEAYRALLGYANAAGVDYQTALQRYRQVVSRYGPRGGAGGDSEIREPFMGTRTDPAALNALLDNVSVRAMGRGLTPEEKARFVSSYHAQEEAVQRQRYEQEGSGLPGGPGGITTDVDPQGRAQEFIRKERPADVGAYQYLQAFKSFENLISRTMR